MAETDGAPLTRAQKLGLSAMALAVLVIANDFTSLSVALPGLEKAFGSDVTTTQWVINGYALVFGVLIVTGGRMADLFGRRRVFFAGSVIFAAFSLLAGLANDVWILLAARCAMGIGGAMMWPATLGMTFGLTPRAKAGLAGALIIGVAGFGNSVGPLLGGALTDTIGWRWIFFVNLPITAFAVLVTWRVVPEERVDSRGESIDYGGVITLSIGLFAFLIALDLGSDLGWTDGRILGLFAVTLVSLAGFGLVERNVGERALVPPEVFANRGFFWSGMATLLCSAIFFAALLYVPQFMIKGLGYTALQSGVGLLPMMGVFGLVSFASGPLYSRLGAKTVVSTGALCLAGGMFLLSRVAPSTPYVRLVPGMVVLGTGTGLFYSSITTVAITALDASKSSLAGAIIYMYQIAGGAIGLGINTAIVVAAPGLSEGIHRAFLFDAGLATAAVGVSVAFVGGSLDRSGLHNLIHRHKAHG